MDNHFISHLSDEMRVIPTTVNSNEGGEAFKLSPQNTMYTEFRKKNVRLKHPTQYTNSVPRPRATINSGCIMTEDAEVEGIVN